MISKTNDIDNKKRLSYVILMVLIILTAVAFVFIFSCSTSPLYKYYIGGDSSVFLLFGRGWLEGKVPYRDMFDHKGPFIFFVNIFGWLFTGTRHGMILIQIPCLVITLLFMTKIASLFSKSIWYRVAVIFVVLTVMTENYIEGDLTEEYCLPFLAASSFFIIKYLYSDCAGKHAWIYAVLYGITSGICLMTRATNAVYVGIASIVIAITLFCHKHYRNIWENIFAFILGLLLVVIPFAVYFYVNGAFGQFIDGTFIQNAEYAKHMVSWTKGARFADYRIFIRRDFTALCIIPTAILAIWRKKYPLFFFCVISALLEIYILTSGAMFAQYAMVELPQVALLINEIMFFISNISKKNWNKIQICTMLVLCLYSALVMAKRVKSASDLMAHCREYNNVGYENLISQIPNDEKNEFVSYGYGYFKEPYLLHNMPFCNKYFILQGWYMEHTPSTIEDLKQEYSQCKAKWILTADYTNAIDDILDNNYSLYDEVEGFQLYKRNE